MVMAGAGMVRPDTARTLRTASNGGDSALTVPGIGQTAIRVVRSAMRHVKVKTASLMTSVNAAEPEASNWAVTVSLRLTGR